MVIITASERLAATVAFDTFRVVVTCNDIKDVPQGKLYLDKAFDDHIN